VSLELLQLVQTPEPGHGTSMETKDHTPPNTMAVDRVLALLTLLILAGMMSMCHAAGISDDVIDLAAPPLKVSSVLLWPIAYF